MFDFIVWLVLFFIVCITKVIGFGIGAYICWYFYKKYGEKLIKGEKQSLFFFQLNYRTNTYNTMKDIILFPIYLIVGLGVFIFVKEIRQEIIMKVKEEL